MAQQPSVPQKIPPASSDAPLTEDEEAALPEYPLADNRHFSTNNNTPSGKHNNPADSLHQNQRFQVLAGAPQLIRVAGFRDVFERYYNHLDQATCCFGVDNEVDCRCDTLHGVMECDVPRSKSTIITQDEGILVVKAQIAEFETPLLSFRYSTSSFDEDANCMLLPSAIGFEQSSALVSSSQQHFPPLPSSSSSSPTQKSQPPQPPSPPSSVPLKSLHTRLLTTISREQSREKAGKLYSLFHQCIAELIGTMFIVVFGVGSVCSAVLLKSDVSLWHIASVWGFGVALAILATASVSGAHLNPAVSLALAIFRPKDFPLRKLLPYWLAQYLGGIVGGAFNLLIFGPAFRHFEAENNIIRNIASDDIRTSGLRTASAFGEYFPAPGGSLPNEAISPIFAMFVEAWGTGILMFIILALTDPRHKLLKNKELIPFYIGFTVSVLITLYAPLTQAGWNPARDFGPRVIAALAGWGRVAIPGPRNGFWVYIVGPKIGAPIGAFLYDFLISPGLIN